MNKYNFFAGANTASGFYSFYNFLAADSHRRVYILKGGPGVGKSTLLKTVAAALGNRFDLEQYHCSADIKSLDGIFIRGLNISLLDGTAPHVVDPKLPGAVHHLVDLGRAWNLDLLVQKRSLIKNLVEQISEQYRSAYRWLGLAAGRHNLDTTPLSPDPAVAKAAGKAANTIISGLPALPRGESSKAFATAITSTGLVSYLPQLAASTPARILLLGGSRQFNTTVLEKVGAFLFDQGVAAKYLYCGLQPEHLEHIYVPGRLGIYSSHSPHELSISGEIFAPIPEPSSELSPAVRGLIDTAIGFLSTARVLHQELEQIYIPATDFSIVNQEREKVLAYIMAEN